MPQVGALCQTQGRTLLSQSSSPFSFISAENLAQVASCGAWLANFRAGSSLKLKFYGALAVRAICRQAELHQGCPQPCLHPQGTLSPALPWTGHHQQEFLPLFAFSFTPARPCWIFLGIAGRAFILCTQVYDGYLCRVSVVGAFISSADNRYKPSLKYTCECTATSKNTLILRKNPSFWRQTNPKERGKLIIK